MGKFSRQILYDSVRVKERKKKELSRFARIETVENSKMKKGGKMKRADEFPSVTILIDFSMARISIEIYMFNCP